MARHDYRDPTTGRFGKPGSALPYGSKDFPRVTEETSVRKGKATQDFLSPHPSNADLKLIAQNRDKGDDNDATETLVYEKVPGPAVVSMGYDERGDLETTITQTVLNSDDPPVETMGYLFNSAEKIGVDMLRATSTIKTVTVRTPLWTEEAFTTNRTLMRHITGTLRTTKNEVVPVGTDADTGFLVVNSTVQDKNKWQAAKSTTRVDSFTVLTSTERDHSASGALTTKTETIVPTGTAAQAMSLNVLESSVEDLDGTHALQSVKQLATGETYPTLTSYHVDHQMNVVITTAKTIVAAGSVTPGVVIKQGQYASIIPHITAGVITSYSINAGGSDYPAGVTATVTGNGAGAQIILTAVGGTITAAAVPTGGGGSGYTTATVTVDASPHIVITEEQEIDKFKSYKVVTTIPQPAAKDATSAVQNTDWLSIAFPPRMVPKNLVSADLAVYTPHAELTQGTRRKWWVISTTKPTVAVDEIFLGYTYLNPTDFNMEQNVLHDGLGASGTLAGIMPASIPSLGEYTIGTCSLLDSGISTRVITLSSSGVTDVVTGVGTSYLTTLASYVGKVVYIGRMPMTISHITSNTQFENVQSFPAGGSSTITFDPGQVVTYDAATAWIGHEKVRKATVRDIAYQMLWEVETLSVVMR